MSMIRAATPEDIPRMVDLGRVMHGESPTFCRVRFDADKLAATIASTITSAGGFAYVAEQGDAVVGGMLAMITPHYFSHDLVACDLALFMAPEHRGGMAAVRLLVLYVQWARSVGAVLVQLGAVAGDPAANEMLARVCERLGARRAGLVMEF